MSESFGMGDDGRKRALRRRLLLTAVVTFFLFGAPGWAAAQGPEFRTVYLRGAPDCGPRPAAGASVDVFSNLLTFRLQAMDEKTSADLFGRQFNQRFFAYRLCLSNGAGPPASPPVIYLLQNFLQVPVIISEASGVSLTAGDLQQLFLHPEFKNSGFSNYAPPASSSVGLCLQANTFYTPASAEQLVEGKIYGLPGGFQLVKPKRMNLNAFQRRNVLAHIIKPLEKIFPQQHIERVLTFPKAVSVGGRRLRLLPCLDYLRAGILVAPIH